MRVGLIIYGSINTLTGGYIYDQQLVKHLESRGVRVKIFSQSNSSTWRRLKNNFSRNFIEEITEFLPDVILQDGMNYFSLFLLNKKLKKACNCPIICIVNLVYSCITYHFLKKLLLKQIETLFFKSFDGFIFNSNSSKESVINLIRNIKNSIVAYPGKDRLKLEVEILSSLRTNGEQLKVMFIGNLCFNKGLHVLIQALAQIDNRLWKLSVIGSLNVDLIYTKQILKMIHDLKLNSNIRIFGVLQGDRLKNQFTSHHVLAVPSYYESYGIIYAEAMGAGLPIIATHSGGAKEIITADINGFLVNPGDIDMVRDSIQKLITNHQLLHTMSQNSLAAYDKLPSWEESMERIFSFLTCFIRVD